MLACRLLGTQQKYNKVLVTILREILERKSKRMFKERQCRVWNGFIDPEDESAVMNFQKP